MRRSKLNRQNKRSDKRALSLFEGQRTKLSDYQGRLRYANVPLTFAPSGRTIRFRLNQVNLTNAFSPLASRDQDVL